MEMCAHSLRVWRDAMLRCLCLCLCFACSRCGSIVVVVVVIDVVVYDRACYILCIEVEAISVQCSWWEVFLALVPFFRWAVQPFLSVSSSWASTRITPGRRYACAPKIARESDCDHHLVGLNVCFARTNAHANKTLCWCMRFNTNYARTLSHANAHSMLGILLVEQNRITLELADRISVSAFSADTTQSVAPTDETILMRECTRNRGAHKWCDELCTRELANRCCRAMSHSSHPHESYQFRCSRYSICWASPTKIVELMAVPQKMIEYPFDAMHHKGWAHLAWYLAYKLSVLQMITILQTMYRRCQTTDMHLFMNYNYDVMYKLSMMFTSNRKVDDINHVGYGNVT